MERSLKMFGNLWSLHLVCVPSDCYLLINGVHIMPGTSKNKTPKLLFKSVSEFFVIGNCLPIL